MEKSTKIQVLFTKEYKFLRKSIIIVNAVPKTYSFSLSQLIGTSAKLTL